MALVLMASLALPAWLLAAVTPQLPDPGSVPGVTKQQQEQVGQQAVSEVYKQMPVLPDSSPVTQYVQRLGRKLAAVIPQQDSWPYQFHVIPEKDINAFALPGGPIFVNLGTITAAANEAELAGVMAHEMSHIYMQHSMKAANKQRASSIIGLLGGLVGAYGGALGSLANMGIQVGAGAVFMKYSRQDEAQADAVGAIILYKAGYDPQAMADFFQKLASQGGSGGGPSFLSSHPDPGNREASIQKEIANWPPKQWVAQGPQFQEAQNAAKGIRTYTAQEIEQGAKQGVWAGQNSRAGAAAADPPASLASNTDNNVVSQAPPPSDAQTVTAGSSLVSLRRSDFRISYPSNWQVAGSKKKLPVAIVPQGGLTQKAVAYGAVIDAYRSQTPNASLDQMTKELINSLRQQEPQLRALGAPQSITINGVQGRSVDLSGVSPVQRNGQPEREHDWLVTLPRSDGTLAYVVFVAPESAYDNLLPTFERMLRTFHLQ